MGSVIANGGMQLSSIQSLGKPWPLHFGHCADMNDVGKVKVVVT